VIAWGASEGALAEADLLNQFQTARLWTPIRSSPQRLNDTRLPSAFRRNRRASKQEQPATMGEGDAPPPRTPVEAFKVAIAASYPARARMVLNPARQAINEA
jgi:hypothetical protein